MLSLARSAVLFKQNESDILKYENIIGNIKGEKHPFFCKNLNGRIHAGIKPDFDII